MTQQQSYRLPEPDFTNSAELRQYLNAVRRSMHGYALALHMGAAELEAALATIVPNVDGGMLERAISRSMRHRRARRVSRHLNHAAECVTAAAAASVRTWGVFRAEYAPELAPVRGRRQRFTVVPE